MPVMKVMSVDVVTGDVVEPGGFDLYACLISPGKEDRLTETVRKLKKAKIVGKWHIVSNVNWLSRSTVFGATPMDVRMVSDAESIEKGGRWAWNIWGQTHWRYAGTKEEAMAAADEAADKYGWRLTEQEWY